MVKLPSFSFSNIVSSLRKVKIGLRKRQILALVLIFIMANIATQIFLMYELPNAQYELVDVHYLGNKGAYSAVAVRLLVKNPGSLPIYVPGIRVELLHSGERGIEAYINKLDIPAGSARLTTILLKLYHTDAAKYILKTLIETGKLDADVKAYVPITLFGTLKIGELPVKIPRDIIEKVMSSLMGTESTQTSSAEVKAAQAGPPGLSFSLGLIMESLLQGTFKIEDFQILPETPDYLEVYVAASGTLPENFRGLGDITLCGLIADVVFNDYGHLLSVLIHPTTIRTAEGTWRIALTIRIYKTDTLDDFLSYVVTTMSIPDGQLILTGTIKIFDITLGNVKISVRLSDLGIASAQTGVSAQQFDMDQLMSMLMQSGIIDIVMGQLTGMFVFENFEYLGTSSTEEGIVHKFKVGVKLINTLGFTFGLRNIKVEVYSYGRMVFEVLIPDEFVLEPFSSASVTVELSVVESEALRQLIYSAISTGDISVSITLKGDVNAFGSWVEGIEISLPISLNIYSLLGIPSPSAAALGLLKTAVTGKVKTQQLEFIAPLLPKHVRVGRFNVWEERSYLKILVENLIEAPALPFAIQNAHLTLFYRGTDVLSIEIPSIDLRPSTIAGAVSNPVVRRRIAVTLSINEDSDRTADLIARALNNDMSILDDIILSGSFDIYIFGVYIASIPIKIEGSMIKSLLGIQSSEVKASQEIPVISMVPFPIDIASILPPELISQLVQLVDITTKPARLIDGVWVYTIKFIAEITNPTQVAISLEQLDVGLYKELNGTKYLIIRIYSEKPLTVLPGSSGRITIVIELYANEALEEALDLLFKNYTLDVVANGSLSLTIGRLQLDDINIITEIVTEIPESVIVSMISSVIAMFQQYLTLEEFLNLIFPAPQEEETQTGLTIQQYEEEGGEEEGGGFFGLPIGNPVIESFSFKSYEYGNNVTIWLSGKIAGLELPLKLILDDVNIDLFYSKYSDKPVATLKMQENEIVEAGEKKYEVTIEVVLHKDASGFADFIKAFFYRQLMDFTINIETTFTFLDFTFENISFEGITVTLPPFVREHIDVWIYEVPEDYIDMIRSLLGLPSAAVYTGARLIAQAVATIAAPTTMFMLNDLEYLGTKEMYSRTAHWLRLNFTLYDWLNISFEIEDSRIELYYDNSPIPSIVICINGSYNWEVGSSESIVVDIYIIEGEETERLLNEILGDYRINATIVSDLNLQVFGVEIDDWTFSSYIFANLRNVVESLLTGLTLGTVKQSGVTVAQASGSMPFEIPVSYDLLESLFHARVVGVLIEEYEDRSEILVSSYIRSDKLSFTVNNFTVSLKLSDYQDYAITVCLASPMEVVKGEERLTQMKLVVWEKDTAQLEDLFTRAVNFDVMTLDISLDVNVTAFGMTIAFPLEITKLTLNISDLLGYSSLEEAVYDMFVPPEQQEATVVAQQTETKEGFPMLVEFDLGALLASIMLPDLIVPIQVKFEEYQGYWEMYVKFTFNNPFGINIGIEKTRIEVVKSGKTLISADVQSVYVPARGAANFTVYVDVYDYPETKDLLAALIAGESYDVNVTGSFKLKLFGANLPEINITLPLSALFGGLGFGGGGGTETSEAVQQLNQILPALGAILGPILLFANVTIRKFLIYENSTGGYTEVVMDITQFAAPIELYSMLFEMKYNGTLIVKAGILEPLNLESGYGTLRILIAVYNDSATEAFLNQILHYGNATVDIFANITVGMFDTQNWIFNLTVNLPNTSLVIGPVFSSSTSTSATIHAAQAESSSIPAIPLPSVGFAFTLPFSITDVIRIWHIHYDGSEAVTINGATFQRHILRIEVGLNNLFNITVGWTGAQLLIEKEGIPVIKVTLEDVPRLPPGSSTNFTITVYLYDTPKTQEFIEEALNMTFNFNATLKAASLVLFGIAIHDVELTIPMMSSPQTSTSSVSAQQTSESSAVSIFDLLSQIDIMSLLGISDPLALLAIAPPLTDFVQNITLSDIALYEVPGKVVIKAALNFTNIIIPISINRVELTAYYPAGSYNPVFGLNISTVQSEPSRNITLVIETYIYKAASSYGSEFFTKLARGEDVAFDLFGTVNLTLFGEQVSGVPSYLTIVMDINMPRISSAGMLPSSSSSSKGTTTETSPEELLNQFNPALAFLGIFALDLNLVMEKKIIKLGKFAFDVLDETRFDAWMKLGIMLKFPIDIGFEDLKVYLKNSTDPTSVFMTLELAEPASFTAGSWAPIYFIVTVYKGEYLECFLRKLLLNWTFSAYIDLQMTIRIGTITIAGVQIGNLPIEIRFPVEDIAENLLGSFLGLTSIPGIGAGGSIKVAQSDDESPPVPGMPTTFLSIDPFSLMGQAVMFFAGYGTNYDASDPWGGIASTVLNGDYIDVQPAKYYAPSDLPAGSADEYPYFMIKGQQYDFEIHTEYGTVNLYIVNPNGEVEYQYLNIGTGSVTFTFYPSQTGAYIIRIEAVTDALYDLTFYRDGASDYVDPSPYSWALLGLRFPVGPMLPNMAIKNLKLNIYYAGQYYTHDDSGNIYATGVYANGDADDLVMELYIAELRISGDTRTMNNIFMRMWRTPRGATNTYSPLESLFAASFAGDEIKLTAANLTFDLEIFGCKINGITIPIAMNFSTAFDLRSMIVTQQSWIELIGDPPTMPLGAVIESTNFGFDWNDFTIRVDIGLRLKMLPFPVYLVYMDLDWFMDDDSIFGWIEWDSITKYLAIHFDDNNVWYPPYPLIGFDKYASPYISGENETPRLINAPSSTPQYYLWLGTGRGRMHVYTSVTLGNVLNLPRAVKNLAVDQHYNDTEEDSDTMSFWVLWPFIKISGEPDGWSILLKNYKVEIIFLWWVIDIFIPGYPVMISADLVWWIAAGYLPGLEKQDAQGGVGGVDPREGWDDLWDSPPRWHTDGIQSYYQDIDGDGIPDATYSGWNGMH